MGRFRWTKLQDFCLRLGLLKALVQVLPAQRQPLQRDFIIQKLQQAVFGARAPRSNRVQAAQSPRHSVAEQHSDVLLRASASKSWGQPIHVTTAYKLLDWGLTTGLVVSGNRISERGLLLRLLAGNAASERGNWNPFILTAGEIAFLFYHLGERDELIWQVAVDVGRHGAGTIIQAAEARSITSRALTKVLARAERNLDLAERGEYLKVRELALRIAEEVSHPDVIANNPGTRLRLARSSPGGSRQATRRGAKNADHQAIPRFEQLVDLGFLTKPVPSELSGKALDKAMKAWTFEVTPSAAAFSAAFGQDERFLEPNWHRYHFARCISAMSGGLQATRGANNREALELFIESFDLIRRSVGHTPFESAAVLTMVRGLEQQVVVEIAQLHHIMLELKRTGGLSGTIYFAAGNDVERMFLIIKRGAREAVEHHFQRAVNHPTHD